MKKIFITLIALCVCITLFAQNTSKTIQHNGLTRSYLEYVPNIYNAGTAVPLVICLHGLGDNMNNFSNIGMRYVADTANFIVLTPQAMPSVYGNAWNSGAGSGGMQLNPNIDDVGFIEALIDSTMLLYNIDPRRIYVTGFSMGGFMSNRLACELNNRIAATASVAGTIGSSLACMPNRAVPVCHFHGTADATVSYTSNAYGLSVAAFIEYWVSNNICDTVPVHTLLPDIAQDGFTVDHYFYGGGEDNSVVELFKINDAGHTWLYLPNNDISYTFEIWKFLSRHTQPEWVSVEKKNIDKSLSIYPNPATTTVYLSLPTHQYVNIELYDNTGRLVAASYQMSTEPFDVSKWSVGLYVLKVFSKDYEFLGREKLIVQ